MLQALTMVTLSEYLRQHNIAVPDFAAKIGVNRVSVYRYLRGDVPKWAVMEKIVKVTKGKVRPDSFLSNAA